MREILQVMMAAGVDRHRQDWPDAVSIRLWESYGSGRHNATSRLVYAPDGCGWAGDRCTSEMWTDFSYCSSYSLDHDMFHTCDSHPIPGDLADWGRPANKERRASQDLVCRQDLQCWGDKHSLDAILTCQPLIESLARYDFKWTSGLFGSKLERWRWDDREEGSLSYRGDEVQFMNGFGAWQRIVYWCHYNPATEAAKVEVFPQ